MAALAALLLGVARAQDATGETGPIGGDAPIPSAGSVEEPGWPFENDAELAAWARRAGSRLANTCFTFSTLLEWSRIMSPLGLQYLDEGRIPSTSNHELWLGHGYGIAQFGSSSMGWVAHPMVKESRSIDPASQLGAHVLPAWRPSVEVLGSDGWTSVLPPREDLPGKLLAVSPGNGRLVLVDLSQGGLARLLPLDMGAVDPGTLMLQGPWGRPEVAMDRLRDFGRMLAGTAKDSVTLAALELVARDFGFRIEQRRVTRSITKELPTFQSPLQVARFRHAAAWTGEGADTGWGIRRETRADGKFPSHASLPAPDGFVPSQGPSITFVTRLRCLSQRPPTDELADADILVTTGNGVLLQIGMGPSGVVTLWPFP